MDNQKDETVLSCDPVLVQTIKDLTAKLKEQEERLKNRDEVISELQKFICREH